MAVRKCYYARLCFSGVGMFRRFGRILRGFVAAVALAALTAPAPASAADPAKVYRTAFPAAETGFDPVRVSDLDRTPSTR